MMNSNEVKPIKYDESLEKSFIRKKTIVDEELRNNSAYVRISTIESRD